MDPRVPERIAARRRESARHLRRRRLAALAALGVALALVAAAAIVLGSQGEDGGAGKKGAAGRSMTSDGGDRSTGSKPVANERPQADWVAHTGPVPIIEYHVLGAAPPDAPYPDLYVTRPDFRRQMDWLDRQGYEAVTLDQVQDAWYQGATLPPKPVVISFDDGYRPQFTFALPELRRHGWAGVLNLKAEGSDLYPSNVEAMIAAGWELASHTISHPDLTTVDAATLRREVAGSRAILRRTYGVPVNNFCYPSGPLRRDRDRRREGRGLRRCHNRGPWLRRPRAPLRAEAARDPRLGRRRRPRLGPRRRLSRFPFRAAPGCRRPPSAASPRRW